MIELLTPPIPTNLDDFYRTLLSVSGVLFGIAFAAMLFILQSGFTSFKYSRRMFLELYLHFGRQLLFSLAYLTAAPFVVLYFPKEGNWSTWLYFIYFVLFLNATLDYAKQEGYIQTLHSSKYVPRHFGRIRSYFRYIRNRGTLRNLLFLIPIPLLFTYPYLISIQETWTVKLSETAIFYSCVIPLFYTLYKVTKFVPDFFAYTGMEIASEDETYKNEVSEGEEQLTKNEKIALREYLISRGVEELDPLSPVKFLDGELWVQFLTDGKKREAWFNINVNIDDSTPEIVRREVLSYAYRLLKHLYESKVDINTFVTSFHISIADQKTRNIFIRANRGELSKIYFAGRNEPEDFAGLEHVMFNALFRV